MFWRRSNNLFLVIVGVALALTSLTACQSKINAVTASSGSNGATGSNVTSWTNLSASTTVTAAIPDGNYSGNSCLLTDSNLVASNIVNGVSIFGVTGSYTGSFNTNMYSTESRSLSQAPMTLYTEDVTDAGTAYTNSTSGYRAVPDINTDDDGYTGGSVTYVNRSTWGSTTCGTTQSTIAARIANCATVFGANATWDGSVDGNAGQGVWKLVTRTGPVTSSMGQEVWQDERTGLLWSSLVSTGINWCMASGNNDITNNPTAETDPSGYCNNSSYQNTGTGPATKAISACFEDGGNYFTNTNAAINNAGKTGLGLSSTPAVAWRLPTIHDYEQAEIDGFRFVMPDMGSSGTWEWAASVVSVARNTAWDFDGKYGSVNSSTRIVTTGGARCVGR